MGFSVNYMAGGRFDTPYFPTKTKPYVKGRRIGIYDAMHIDKTTLSFDTEIIAFSVAASNYSDSDHWSLFINDELIADEVYIKDVPEGFNFSVIKPIPAGAILRFEYHNRSAEQKTVWLNYQLLKD
ncbi:hypothetical protein BAMA_15720 [Bacillus manliponensis]|uniref:Low copy number virion structural protein n=1 Tax=Bacillus manliponensis TaxID=574376 RepID=A0A073JQH4_9BACI|nr:hypothetical protein [Bacillus manliponensis]KEK17334.1 hypothetical protein BAMA_15720 [Bacillus manliponensis]